MLWGGYETENTGYLGDGVVSRSNVPVVVTADSAFIEIAVGAGNSCARTASGQAWCWGANMRGEVGDGTLLGGTTGGGGSARGPCRTTTGAAQCWGSNWFGAQGNATRSDTGSPMPVTIPGCDVSALSVGSSRACGLRPNGVLLCSGDRPYGQVGY